ncbi:MAG TPA: molybdopterin-synthase adenylyltransferase MoeB [Gemmatimonadaceae bacterium]|jgi:adenylyltransferase/sulfurtransferase
MASLDVQDLSRYARQIRLPQVGVDGQTALKNASVLLVGAGGLGSPAALYLAAAGVGRIGIADADLVDVTNLQRQILYGTDNVGSRKTDIAVDRLSALNPEIEIEPIAERVTRMNALGLVQSYDVVIDGTDNFPTRYLLSDACVLTDTPLIYGSIDRFEGQLSVFVANDGPCYRCLFPMPPEPGSVDNCADAGVLGVLPGLVGTAQATEALKLILGIGEPLVGRLLMVDALHMRFRTIGVDRDPACPACGTHEITQLIDYDAFCASTAPVRITNPMNDIETITPRELNELLKGEHSITLIDVREPHEFNYARIDGAQLIPLGTIASAIPAIDPEADIVVYCHHGTRSEMAAHAIRDAGIAHVRNLVGGIDRWSREVDPAVPRY